MPDADSALSQYRGRVSCCKVQLVFLRAQQRLGVMSSGTVYIMEVAAGQETHPRHVVVVDLEDVHVKAHIGDLQNLDLQVEILCAVVPQQHRSSAFKGIETSHQLNGIIGCIRGLRKHNKLASEDVPRTP